MTATYPIQAAIRCRPFTGGKMGVHRVRVYGPDEIRVYDDVAGYYTTCHILTARHAGKVVREGRCVSE